MSGRLVRGARADGGWVEVRGGRIAGTGPGDPPRPADVHHHGTIAPGFVDLQVNGGAERAAAEPGEYVQAGVRIRLRADGRIVNRDGALAGSAIALDAERGKWVAGG